MGDLTSDIRLAGSFTPERVIQKKPESLNAGSIEGGQALSLENVVSLGDGREARETPLMPSSLPKKPAEEGTVRHDGKSHDQYLLHDTFDSSRDIVSFSAREGKPYEAYHFTVKMHDLFRGAQHGNLDTYLLVSTGKEGATGLPDGKKGSTEVPWSLGIGVYDENNYRVFNNKGIEYGRENVKDIKFDPVKNTVEFSLDKSVLRSEGWQDGGSLKFQPFTAKDFSQQVTDSLDDPATKSWVTGRLSAAADTSQPSHIIEKPPQTDWSKEIIYSVVTDRFFDGDSTNNFLVEKGNLRMWQGGDLQGLIDKLDYIKDLGVSTVWVSPTMDSQDFITTQEGVKDGGYHGYWPMDFFKMEEHQGSMEKFKEFIGKAHDNGLKVILDIPLNHTGYANPMVKDPDKQDWFHHNGDVTDWNNDWQQENCSAFGLPDFNTDNPEVKNFLVEVAKFWIDTGIDGFRLDAVRSIPSNFWNEFNREVHKHAGDDFLLIGEYFHGDPAKVAPYQRDDMPSVFDYPLFFPVERVFGHGASMKEIAEELERGNNLYEHPEMMSYFPDNHDKTRLMTQVKGDREKHKLVLSFAMTLNRIPTIYYGTETGMEGADPDKGMELNRDMMKFDQNPDIKEHFKTLTSLRNSSPALQEGKLLQMYVDDDVFAFSRLHPEQEAIVVMNNGSSAHDREIAMRPESQMKDGTMLKDALSGDRVKVENGKIKTRVNEKSARIFFKE